MKHIPLSMIRRGKLLCQLGVLSVILGVAAGSSETATIGTAACLLMVGYSKMEIARYRGAHHPFPN